MTYSLSVTGVSAGSPFQVSDLKLSDSDSTGDVIGTSFASQGSTMRTGAQVLCKNPDGSQSWYTIDAERSTASKLVMRAVGP